MPQKGCGNRSTSEAAIRAVANYTDACEHNGLRYVGVGAFKCIGDRPQIPGLTSISRVCDRKLHAFFITAARTFTVDSPVIEYHIIKSVISVLNVRDVSWLETLGTLEQGNQNIHCQLNGQ